MRHTPGLIGWVDLTTTDVEAAKTFYSELLGWELRDLPVPGGPPYTEAYKDGLLVAGMGPQPPEAAAAGVPSLWSSYVMVKDAQKVAESAERAGGRVVMPVMDVMTAGRMAMIADPTGAVLGVWQPRDHQGAEVFNQPGTLTWNELQTRDLQTATAFYAEVFGWRWQTYDDSGYQVAMLDDKPGEDKSNAGAMTMPDAVPAEAPSCWMVYLAVEDTAASLTRAQELGATVFLPVTQMGAGSFAGIADPTGAMLLLASGMS